MSGEGEGRARAGFTCCEFSASPAQAEQRKGKSFCARKILAIYFPMLESGTSLSLLKILFLQSSLNVRYLKFRISQAYVIKKSGLDK